MAYDSKFTVTQQKILAVLADGLPHARDELHEQLRDELGNLASSDPRAKYVNLNTHISHIRQKIRPVGQDIICELHARAIHYRHVRLLANSE